MFPVPFLTQTVAGLRDSLVVFGDDYPTPDGSCIRDYLHICDLADAHLAALKNIPSGVRTYNLGTGKGTSVLDLISCFEEVNNIKVPYVFSERRHGDMPYVVADNSKALEILEWEPKRTLKEMCIDGWKWQKSNPNGYLDKI